MNKFIKKILLLILISSAAVFLSVRVPVRAEEKVPLLDYRGETIKHYKSNRDVMVNAEYVMKETDMRACWVSAYVNDINPFTSKSQYQSQIIEVLDNMKAFKLNTMVFHIRIMNDAFYPSKYNKYSKYYNTHPDWDCLPWIIKACHQRGIEFHAWMNPYRVSSAPNDPKTIAENFRGNNVASDPKNLLKGKNSVILNPGLPRVRDWLVKVCMEVVENYDVDAIHFDDYFYDANIDDSDTRLIYNPDKMNIDDWRRKQVDLFIEELSHSLREFNDEHNRCVQLGISPSGVYRADSNPDNGFGVVEYDPVTGIVSSDGSRTASASFQHYGKYLYSDTLKWINEGWIDYIVPQTYWALDHPSCPYADLMEWWNEVCGYKNVNLYSGIGIYKHTEKNGYGWYKNKREAHDQIMVCNSLAHVNGVCFFKYTDIKAALINSEVAKGIGSLWRKPAILPEIRSMRKTEPGKPEHLSVCVNKAGYKISFDRVPNAKFYVVYRSEEPFDDESGTGFDPEKVLDVIGDLSVDGVVSYTDTNVDKNKTYYYGVRAQSYSLTLGSGRSVSSQNAPQGDLTDLGTIEEFKLIDSTAVDRRIIFLFTPHTYPYGGEISYKISYRFDDGSEKELSKFTNFGDYWRAELTIPENTTRLRAVLTAENKIGSTMKTLEYRFVGSLPMIENFCIKGDFYTGCHALFIWNNCFYDDATYYVMESSDRITWTTIEEISAGTTGGFNIRRFIRLSERAGKMYYRVMVKKDDLCGFSQTVSKNIRKHLGPFQNLLVNEKKPKKNYRFPEGDELEITWKALQSKTGFVSYSAFVSFNNKDWFTIKIYSPDALITVDNGLGKLTFSIPDTKLKFYLKIEGNDERGQNESDVFGFHVQTEELYSDEVASYMFGETTIKLNETGIYR